MVSKRLLLMALVAVTVAAAAGCGLRRSSCRDSYAPSYYDDCR
jgi:hypothetical protein